MMMVRCGCIGGASGGGVGIDYCAFQIRSKCSCRWWRFYQFFLIHRQYYRIDNNIKQKKRKNYHLNKQTNIDIKQDVRENKSKIF